ncbi:MAG: hypothetical protein A4E52_00556 [Pelotomaculum sp. PtaB.Bin013]|nr:MAG: hypothetical protein A4E52_00556 [Pelotomaculum sp. PtaB.Bin013]
MESETGPVGRVYVYIMIYTGAEDLQGLVGGERNAGVGIQGRTGVSGCIHGLDAEGVAAGDQPGDVVVPGGAGHGIYQGAVLVNLIAGDAHVVGGRRPAQVHAAAGGGGGQDAAFRPGGCFGVGRCVYGDRHGGCGRGVTGLAGGDGDVGVARGQGGDCAGGVYGGHGFVAGRVAQGGIIRVNCGSDGPGGADIQGDGGRVHAQGDAAPAGHAKLPVVPGGGDYRVVNVI